MKNVSKLGVLILALFTFESTGLAFGGCGLAYGLSGAAHGFNNQATQFQRLVSSPGGHGRHNWRLAGMAENLSADAKEVSDSVDRNEKCQQLERKFNRLSNGMRYLSRAVYQGYGTEQYIYKFRSMENYFDNLRIAVQRALRSSF